MNNTEQAPVTLRGKSFCITGKTDEYRDIYYALIVHGGGRWTQSVSGSLDFLVVGTDPGPAKMAKAHALGTRCITEQELNTCIRRELGVSDDVRLFSIGWRLPVENTGSSRKQRSQQSQLPPGALKVCITGTLDMKRAKYVELMNKAGWIVAKDISASVDYLIVGDAPGSKLKKAQALNIPVRTLGWLKSELGMESDTPDE